MKKNKNLYWIIGLSVLIVIILLSLAIFANLNIQPSENGGTEPSTLNDMITLISQLKYNNSSLISNCNSYGCEFTPEIIPPDDADPAFIGVYDLTTFNKKCDADLSSKYQVYTGFNYERKFYYNNYGSGIQYFWCAKSNEAITLTSNKIILINSYFQSI